jgi:glucosamine 6-phosphate synthetase-like amidotransferase/phosphosugar isomerase protein
VAESGVGAVVVGSGREIRLAQDLAGLGVPVLLVTDASVSFGGGLEVFRLPEVDRVVAPVLQAVPAQLVAEAMARHRGISPGALRHQQEDTRVNPR